MPEAGKPAISPQIAYAAISTAMLLPVIFWPLQTINNHGSASGLNIHDIWLLSAAALLLCAVTTDSILSYQASTLWPFSTTAWIVLASMAVSTAMRVDFGPHVLAAFFGIHALRSTIRLWKDDKNWWLWTAWMRDSTASLSMFIWLILLQKNL